MCYMSDQPRNEKIYYAHCPNDNEHFILADPESPLCNHHQPAIPSVTDCRACGEHVQVKITEAWKMGWVSFQEREHLWTYDEPQNKPST
jgi:hypothetical protein